MNLLLAALILFSTPASAEIASRGASSTISVGGRVFTDLANLKILSCSALGPTNIRCSLALSTAPTAGYQVPAATTFRARAVKWLDTDSATLSTITFYQSDNDTGQTGAATAFTAGSQKTWSHSTFLPDAAAGASQEFPANFTIAAAKYLGAQLSAVSKTVQVFVYGYEE